MVKITQPALDAITKEIQDVIDEGKKPFIRFSMAAG
jgi:hypothetical protein